MIEHSWHNNHSILEVRPIGALSAADFRALSAQVDPIIREHGSLQGLLIKAENFPGWESFAAMSSHCIFIRDHQKHIHKIAVVSDQTLLGLMPRLVDHFISAEVRPFAEAEFAAALEWLSEAG